MDENMKTTEIAVLGTVIKREYKSSNCLDELGLAIRLHAAGYRLDPYPNGTSKDELIARIETVEAERDKTRNLLRKEHEWYVKEAVATENGTMEEAMEWHRRRKPTCSVCAFLAETSTVKP